MAWTVEQILDLIPEYIKTGDPENIKSFNVRPLLEEIAKNLPRNREGAENGKHYILKAAADIKNEGEFLIHMVELGEIYPVKETKYYQFEYEGDDTVTLPIIATEIPFIIIDSTTFQMNTGAFTVSFGVSTASLTLTAGYALEGQKIMIVYK